MALIESGLINAISPAGATGFWQFLKGTAIEYGLKGTAAITGQEASKLAEEMGFQDGKELILGKNQLL